MEKARKFMSNAKTSAARHGIDFEEKIVTSTDTIKTITNFAKSGKFDIIVIGAREQDLQNLNFLEACQTVYFTALAYLYL